jgi:hypothetical protein
MIINLSLIRTQSLPPNRYVNASGTLTGISSDSHEDEVNNVPPVRGERYLHPAITPKDHVTQLHVLIHQNQNQCMTIKSSAMRLPALPTKPSPPPTKFRRGSAAGAGPSNPPRFRGIPIKFAPPQNITDP